jgi:hypothetical protein
MSNAGTTGAVIALAAAAWLAAGAPAAGSASPPAFEAREIGVRTQLLFDLGVVDFDGDGDLDAFTTNHNDREVLLSNEGGGVFRDRLSEVDLDQQPQFPGFEVPKPPPMSENGIYLFRTPGTDAAEGALRVAVKAPAGNEVTGRIEFLFPVTVNRNQGAEVSQELDTSRFPARYVVDFTTRGDALIELEPEQMATPIEVAVGPGHPLSRIFVGALGIRPPAHRFTLQLRDRHGMAWADYSRDGLMDVFIARGGLKRRVGEFAGFISDELMLGDGSTFHDAIATSGVVKGACRGRDASPVDFNRDGLLDIFYGCQAANPALYRQNPDGTFTDRSAGLVRKRVTGSHFRWLDVNGDGRDELLAQRRSRLVVYGRSSGGRWSKREGIRMGGESPSRLAVADYDDDGDPDLLSAAPTMNTLLENRSGHFLVRRPGPRGLPTGGSFAASWVDYDNDGRTDLYAAPQGLFRNNGSRFRRTGLAASLPTMNDAIGTWFDFDADGTRDLLLYNSDPAFQVATLFENQGLGNHWLEVELRGPGGEYPAAGARVRVRTGDRVQTQWVGQNDGSRYSAGHYRLYFGLGDAKQADSVKVRWPNGSVRKLHGVRADRLLHVSFERG